MSNREFTVTVPPLVALIVASIVVALAKHDRPRGHILITDRGAELRLKYPPFASSFHPRGNARSVQFLKWAQSKSAPYASVELDENGDITRLLVDVCYHVTDEELKVIAALPRLERLVFYTSSASDDGLRCLQSIKSLQVLSIIGFSTSHISESAVHELKQRNPNLKVTLSL